MTFTFKRMSNILNTISKTNIVCIDKFRNKPRKQSEKMLQMDSKCPRRPFSPRRSGGAINTVSIRSSKAPHLQRVEKLL